MAAQERSPAAEAALEKLCRTYWWPLYGFVRRQGSSPEEAQDLTQGFFEMLLERRDLESVRREKGRLRSYLLVSLKNFLAKAHRDELNPALVIVDGAQGAQTASVIANPNAMLPPICSCHCRSTVKKY